MKKVLIIADGILAKYFLERAITLSNDSNDYTIVYYRKKTLPNYAFPENFETYSFDPTSFEKMMLVMKKDYYQIMIVVSKKIDAAGSYKTVRQFDKKVPIFLMDRWGLKFKDKYLTLIESKEVMAYRFADFLPNTPVTAQNVGLAIGEIMDVQVPVGSSYAYRHIGAIEQTKWRIAAVYRNNNLLLPQQNLMIQPNDSLLIVGDPDILQNVYKSIKKELGQFPLPFGSSIYCLIDMKKMNSARIEKLLDNALFLHAKLNSKKLYIKIINPTYSSVLIKIKELVNDDIDVNIDYYNISHEHIYEKDVYNLNIGLCVTDKLFFNSNIKALFEYKTPVFKSGQIPLSEVKRGIVLGGNIDDAERNSSIMFDFSAQLNLKMQFYDFDPDNFNEKTALIEHFENIAKLYEKKIEIAKRSEKNPILEFKDISDILQFIPFYEEFSKSRVLSVFSKDLNRVHFVLEDKCQLFLPILE
ncbi:MAG: potassium transporter TrkA [Campylobacteraceae bacterium]|jgi:hypothetical protein|nr:potassium transporter TrkA [Campylobacteraceae bacterium]